MSIKTKLIRQLAGSVATLVFCLTATANEFTVTVVDSDQQPVSDIVVYLTPSSGVEKLAPNTEPLIIDQKDKKFSPYITVLQKGQALNFVNKDDITHHIYSVSGENRFEFKIKEGETKTTHELMSTEEVAMGCNIHDWMSGYALVVETPVFGKTDEQGKLTVTLPVKDSYHVTVWHPQLDVEANRVSTLLELTADNMSHVIKLPKKLLPIPEQVGQDEFDFLEGY